MKHSARAIRILCLLLSIWLAGCAQQMTVRNDAFPPLQNQSLPSIADHDVLAMTPPMERFVERYIDQDRSPLQRLRLLTQALTHPGLMGFTYNADLTFTADQAFVRGAGNCIAFANLFVALARHAGFKAVYQEAQVQPEWDEANNLYRLAKHVNVVVHLPNSSHVVDVSRRGFADVAELKEISDDYAKAQYYNNLGVEALLAEEVPLAHAYFRKAISIQPRSDYIWSNLGVAYNRNGQQEDAIWAYQQALKISKNALMAMSNLSALHQLRGEAEQAEALQKRVARYRQENPYYLLMRGHQALADQRLDEAVQLFRKAVRKKRNEHRIHLALAKAYFLSGQTEQAQQSFKHAHDLAPVSLQKGIYSKSLAALMAEETQPE